MSLSAGTRLGPYEIVARLGAGGMGEVYRARDHRLGRDVAVKTLRGPITRAHVRRLELEARATAALNHPNIIAIYDVGTESDLVYVVTELLEGENLRAVLRRGRLEPSPAMAYARQIADALAAAHAKGVVHRDLKPENVFVLPGGRIKLLDFGVAKLVTVDAVAAGDLETMSVLTMAGDLVGTPEYLAPEQARGRAVDHRVDIFSFGVVLYEMLTGESPFRRETTADALSAILRDSPKPIAGDDPATAAASRIVQRCLEKDPQARFQSANDLRFALDGVSPQPARAGARVRALIPAAVAVGVFVAIVWSVYEFGGRGSAPRNEPTTTSVAARPVVQTIPVPEPIDGAALANNSVTKMVETLRGHQFADEPSINGTADTVAPLFTGGGQSKVRVSLSVHGASIKALVQLIATSIGWPMIVDPSVKGNVTLDLQNVPWDGVVSTCLEFQGAELTQSRIGGVWLVSSKARAAEYVTDLLEVWIPRSRRVEPSALARLLEPARTQHGWIVPNARLNAVVIVDQLEAFPDYARILAAVDGADARTLTFPRRSQQFVGTPVSLGLTGAGLREVLRTFQDISGLNIVMDLPSKPTETVTMSLRETPWDNALDVLLFASSMVRSDHGNLVHIAPAAKEQMDVTVEVIPLKRENPAFFDSAFQQYLTPRGSMRADSQSRTLIIQDTTHRVAALKRLVKAIDDRVR